MCWIGEPAPNLMHLWCAGEHIHLLAPGETPATPWASSDQRRTKEAVQSESGPRGLLTRPRMQPNDSILAPPPSQVGGEFKQLGADSWIPPVVGTCPPLPKTVSLHATVSCNEFLDSIFVSAYPTPQKIWFKSSAIVYRRERDAMQ